MTAIGTEILQDLVSTARSTDVFSLVVLGDAGNSTASLRACIHLESQEAFQCDDSPSTTWVRLNVRIRIHARHSAAGQGVARVMDVCSILAGAILNDPYRGGRCRDLPLGRASEILRCEVDSSIRRPEIEAVLHVRCHFESEGGL